MLAAGLAHEINNPLTYVLGSLAMGAERLAAEPTINIEGLVGGYTGPGGKTILPVTELPEVTIALFADPEGHVVGLAKGM